jgi:2-polyprenyl-6-methoxyphenol hydroxylase-like FAD-dependent oxidoreductase
VPIDVLWLRLSRQNSDPENGLGYINYGRLLVLINRIDYFQIAYIIAKDTFSQVQQAGLPAFQQSIARIVPFLADRVAEIDSWDKVKLLTVQVNRLQQWSSPGLLCIGDAAHAMSPVGGIGINIALQDAVATANMLSEALRTNSLTPHHLIQVQQYREKVVRRTQAFQVFAHRILNRVLLNPGPVHAPLIVRFILHIPGFKYLTARMIGIGVQPEHISQPAESL